jgi:hypothetical protein
MVPLKKAHASKPFKQLDNMINRSGKMPLPGVKTLLVPRQAKSKRLTANVITPKVNLLIPTPANGKVFGVVKAMEALITCPPRKMRSWCDYWKKWRTCQLATNK